ncbi:hypothetical protein FRC17_004060, partial [Serendipita sp. 399]
ERPKQKRTSIGSIFGRPISVSGKSSGSGQEDKVVDAEVVGKHDDPLGPGLKSIQREKPDEEMEETPKPRRQYSSSVDVAPVSQPRLPIFSRRPPPKQASSQELTRKIEDADPFRTEEPRPRSQSTVQNEPRFAERIGETQLDNANESRDGYPNISEMEERLKKMMSDLEQVEGGLKAVRAKLKAQ